MLLAKKLCLLVHIAKKIHTMAQMMHCSSRQAGRQAGRPAGRKADSRRRSMPSNVQVQFWPRMRACRPPLHAEVQAALQIARYRAIVPAGGSDQCRGIWPVPPAVRHGGDAPAPSPGACRGAPTGGGLAAPDHVPRPLLQGRAGGPDASPRMKQTRPSAGGACKAGPAGPMPLPSSPPLRPRVASPSTAHSAA